MERDEALRRYDVAIWRRWPPAADALPVLGVVTAWDAAEAVAAVMRVHGMQTAGHVAARELGQRFVHRAYGVRLHDVGALVRQAEYGKPYGRR